MCFTRKMRTNNLERGEAKPNVNAWTFVRTWISWYFALCTFGYFVKHFNGFGLLKRTPGQLYNCFDDFPAGPNTFER